MRQGIASDLMRSGNCALVTRKVEMARACSWRTRALISGYMMGSPTSDSAQCRGWRRQPHISALALEGMQSPGCHLHWAFIPGSQMRSSPG